MNCIYTVCVQQSWGARIFHGRVAFYKIFTSHLFSSFNVTNTCNSNALELLVTLNNSNAQYLPTEYHFYYINSITCSDALDIFFCLNIKVSIFSMLSYFLILLCVHNYAFIFGIAHMVCFEWMQV